MIRSPSLLHIPRTRIRSANYLAAVVVGWVLVLVLAVEVMIRILTFLRPAVFSAVIPANTLVVQVENLVSLALTATASERAVTLVRQKSAAVRVAPSQVAVDPNLDQRRPSRPTVQTQKRAKTISGRSSPSVLYGVQRDTMSLPYPLV